MPLRDAITPLADCYPDAMAATTVTFVELAGDRARDELTAFAARIAPLGTPCELMASTTQATLYLLVCRGAPATDDAPSDARVWTFETLESFA